MRNQKNVSLLDAILSLVPNAQVVAIGENITWHDPQEPPVTLEQIKEEQQRLQSLPQNPEPNYLAFWNALLNSSVYSAIREQSFVSLPINTLATEFIALIGDAKAGRPNEIAIRQSIYTILSVGTFTEEHLIELQEAVVSGNLQYLYTLSPEPETPEEPTEPETPEEPVVTEEPTEPETPEEPTE